MHTVVVIHQDPDNLAADAGGNDEDPVLALVPPERRATLIARRDGAGPYRFDIRLQGAGETVFFDV